MSNSAEVAPPAQIYQDVAKADAINNYWKLDTVDPEEAVKQLTSLDNTRFIFELTPERAQYLHQRVQRDMVLYERCTVEELRKFCADRRIMSCGIGKETAEVLIQTLEHADEFATFPKFPNLPAELREHVYHHYMVDLKSAQTFPSQPPLLRASSQVRHEAYALFYRDRVFSISLPIGHNMTDLERAEAQKRYTSYQRVLGVRSLAEFLSNIEKLYVCGEMQYRGSTSSWAFELGQGNNEGVCFLGSLYFKGDQSVAVFLKELIEGRVKCLKARFAAREEGLLQPGDYGELLQVFGRSAVGFKERRMRA